MTSVSCQPNHGSECLCLYVSNVPKYWISAANLWESGSRWCRSWLDYVQLGWALVHVERLDCNVYFPSCSLVWGFYFPPSPALGRRVGVYNAFSCCDVSLLTCCEPLAPLQRVLHWVFVCLAPYLDSSNICIDRTCHGPQPIGSCSRASQDERQSVVICM